GRARRAPSRPAPCRDPCRGPCPARVSSRPPASVRTHRSASSGRRRLPHLRRRGQRRSSSRRRPAAGGEEPLTQLGGQRMELVLLQPCPGAAVEEERVPHLGARPHLARWEEGALTGGESVDGERLERGRAPAPLLLEEALLDGDA